MEVYPSGHERAGELRYRTAFVSVARQNGKSVIGAVLGLWGLLRQRAGLTIGIARNAEQAGIVYSRTLEAVKSNPALAQKFRRITGTRGLETVDGSIYMLKPAVSGSLQGLAVTTGIVDEVHLVKPELWGDLLRGMGGRKDGFLFGITTAGSNDSKLLLDLYERANKAADGDPALERFGAWIWQAPESRIPEDDDELIELAKPANPRLAEGTVDAQTWLSDLRSTPGGEAEIIRYSLNRFIGTVEGFIPPEAWWKCQRKAGSKFPTGLQLVIGVDVSPSLSFVTFTASALDPATGITHTKVIASRPNPDLAWMLRAAEKIHGWHGPALWIMDGFHLRDLGNELKKRGYPVRITSKVDAINASNLMLAKVMRGKLSHGGDPLLAVQLNTAKRKEVDGSYRVVGPEIDAIFSTAISILGAESAAESSGLMVF